MAAGMTEKTAERRKIVLLALALAVATMVLYAYKAALQVAPGFGEAKARLDVLGASRGTLQ